MPTYLPPRQGISQSRAYAEAAAFGRAGDPVLLTSALYHSRIRNPKTGAQMAIYTVNDFQPLRATVEADAPLDGGQEVEFRAVPMEIQLPDESEDAPSATVTEHISDATREIVPHLEAVLGSNEPIEQIFRTYLPSDTSAPHETPPLRVVLTKASASAAGVTAQAGFGDITNRRFPRLDYRAEDFPCLAAI